MVVTFHAATLATGRAVAVGNGITPAPPHRSGRAAFPHPALLEDNGMAFAISYAAVGFTCVVRLCVRSKVPNLPLSPQVNPFPPPTPPLSPALFVGFIGTMGSSDFSGPYIDGVLLPVAGRAGARSNSRSPRFQRAPCARNEVSDPGRAMVPRISVPHMLPSPG